MALSNFEQAVEAARYIQSKIPRKVPRIAIVLGSGLGTVAEAVSNPVVLPYSAIPHFPLSTIEGHSGRLLLGELNEVPVAVMQGRVHFYEGYSPQQVTFPMRVLGCLGIEIVVLTNAAGGIRSGLAVGQLMLIADHINLLGFNPLVGPNEPRFGRDARSGLRFFDMTEAYDKSLRELARITARKQNLALEEGVYLAVSGPSFETPAEIRAFQCLGADLVGMSTVPETIVARHMGLRVLGLSCVTNLAAGISETLLSHQEVFEAGRRVQHQLTAFLTQLAPALAAQLEAPTSEQPS
uniref:purine-nucleoside phosphorylase n=1 Tax=mine drainage metagenome TaxID=410659 RepID=E6QJW0_9ZZZZ